MDLELRFFPCAAKMQRLYRRYFRCADAAHCFSPNEVAVLDHLLRSSQQGDTATDIAQSRGISKALVTRSVGTLSACGLVASRRDAQDRRVIHLHLTDAGHSTAVRLDENRRYISARLQQGIAPEELERMAQVLEQMQRNLDALLEQDERMK